MKYKDLTIHQKINLRSRSIVRNTSLSWVKYWRLIFEKEINMFETEYPWILTKHFYFNGLLARIK